MLVWLRAPPPEGSAALRLQSQLLRRRKADETQRSARYQELSGAKVAHKHTHTLFNFQLRLCDRTAVHRLIHRQPDCKDNENSTNKWRSGE